MVYGSGYSVFANMGINYLDSPSTTSSITYQVYFRSFSAVNSSLNSANVKSSITCLEIKG